MQLAEEDHDRGTLPDEKRSTVFEHVNDWADDFIAREGGAAQRPPRQPPPPRSAPPVLCVPPKTRRTRSSPSCSPRCCSRHGIERDRAEGFPERRAGAGCRRHLGPAARCGHRRSTRLQRACATVGPGCRSSSACGTRAATCERPAPALEAVGATSVFTSFAECMACSKSHSRPPAVQRSLTAAAPSATAP